MTGFIIFIVTAYLIGSVPTAIWYGRVFHKTDIRQHGSGNAGATNTVRTFGRKAGIIVLLIDIAKGALGVLLPVIIACITNPAPGDYFYFKPEWLTYPQLAFGLAAALGHIYPVYEKFKGGKGVATLFGVILALHPLSALSAVIVFLIIFMASRRVSLGSILSAWAFAAAFIIFNHALMQATDYVLVCIYPLLLLYTHRSNVQRLLNGTEPKLSLGSKK